MTAPAATPRGWALDRIARRIAPALVVALLAWIPYSVLMEGYRAGSGLIGTIQLGRHFEPHALPELRGLDPPVYSEWGYDGQFYAQLALDPALRRPSQLAAAIDDAGYRSRRIGVPAIAWLLGLGDPFRVLNVYVASSFGFCLVLIAGLWRWVGLRRVRDGLLGASLVWTTGTLVCLERALVDSAALALSLLAVWQPVGGLRAAWLMAAACLVRETSVLEIPAVSWPERLTPAAWRHALRWLLILAPAAAWSIYARSVLPAGKGGSVAANFAPPFASLWWKLGDAFETWRATPADAPTWLQANFELLAPVSLLVQAAYLVRHPRVDSAAWRLGAGFVPLMLVLSQDVWIEQRAFCRVLLPLTASFNLLIHDREPPARYAGWFLAGNAGLVWILLRTLGMGP